LHKALPQKKDSAHKHILRKEEYNSIQEKFFSYPEKHLFFMSKVVFSVVPAGMTAAGVTASAAGMTAAGVTPFMVMVIAMEILTHFQRSIQKGQNHFFHIAFGSADNFYIIFLKSFDRSGTDSAADQCGNTGFGQQTGQRTVTGFSGGEHCFADHGFIGDFVNCKTGGVAKVLKNFVVAASDCYFHNIKPWVEMLQSEFGFQFRFFHKSD
jgi:hypothetical protein